MIIKTKIGLKTNGQLKNGEFPVAVMLYLKKGKRARGFNIHHSITQDEFKKVEMAGITKRGNYYDLWLTFEEFKQKADIILKTMDNWNEDKFLAKFYGNISMNVYGTIDTIIAEKAKIERIRIKRKYESLKESLKDFAGENLDFKDLTIDWCFAFQKWHLEKGNSMATVDSGLTLLRAVINRASDDGIDTIYPFGKKGYKIKIHRKQKEAIELNDLRSMLTHDPTSIQEANAQAYFKFSLLSNGMNPRDICELKQENLMGDIFKFTRTKTRFGQSSEAMEIIVELTKDLNDIISQFGQRTLNPGDYIFPMFTHEMDEEDKIKISSQFSKTTNKYLRQIAKTLKINADITMSKARDSFATLAVDNNVPLTVISKAMGHANTKTTEHYIASLGKGQIEGVQAKLMNSIGL